MNNKAIEDALDYLTSRIAIRDRHYNESAWFETVAVAYEDHGRPLYANYWRKMNHVMFDRSGQVYIWSDQTEKQKTVVEPGTGHSVRQVLYEELVRSFERTHPRARADQ